LQKTGIEEARDEKAGLSANGHCVIGCFFLNAHNVMKKNKIVL